MASEPNHEFEIEVIATPEEVWNAITNGELTKQYFYDSRVASTWQPGTGVTYTQPDGTRVIEGTVIEADRPRRLVHTFRFPANDDRASRVTWEIEPRGTGSRVTLIHEDFDGETETYNSVAEGWVPVMDGLKSLLDASAPIT